MMTGEIYKDHALLFNEIPLFWGCNKGSEPEAIFVPEGEQRIEGIDNISFADAGGGVSLQSSDLTRSVYWRTHGNTLELIEYLLDADLHSNHFLITFEGSKVIPGACISLDRNVLKIVCCTVHAVHCITFDVKSALKQQDLKSVRTHPSLLMNLPSFDFQDPTKNFAFGHQIQGHVLAFSAGLTLSEGEVIAANTSAGNLVLVKMGRGNEPSHVVLNQSSAISRLWSGINPWAGMAGSEDVADMKIFTLESKAYLAAVCKDHKLRIWSCQTQELYRPVDFSEYVLGHDDSAERKDCAHKLRVSNDNALLSVYVGVAGQARFLQFKVIAGQRNGPVTLEYFSLVSSSVMSQEMPYRHVVDYCLDSSYCLTVLWRDIEDTDFISICKTKVGVWHDVALCPTPVPEILLQPDQDVREAYIDYIFSPQRFSPVAICRALSIHRKTPSVFGRGLGIQNLKDRVSMHVQQEIQKHYDTEEDVDEDAIQVLAWNDFYQTCVQYQQVVSRSLGLLVDVSGKTGGLMSVVKKEFVSVLTPVSALEAVCKGSDPDILSEFLRPEGFTANHFLELSKMLECLGNLNNLLGNGMLDLLRQNLSLAGSDPIDVINDAMPDVLCIIRESMGNNGPEDFLADVDDVSVGVRMLLVCLEPPGIGIDVNGGDNWPSGSLGAELVACNLLRHIENKFELVVLLFTLSAIFETSGRPKTHGPRDDVVQLASKVTVYLQAFRALRWISSVQTQNISQTSLENTMKLLSVHDMDESGLAAGSKDFRSVIRTGKPANLLEFFLTAEGGKFVKAFLKSSCDTDNQQPSFECVLDQATIAASVNCLNHLLWPLGPTLVLPDFLLSHGQYSLLQRYLQHETGDRCNWCPKSRSYLLAHCQLYHGDYNKAIRSFILAASGVGAEDYLTNKLLQDDEDHLQPAAKEIIYYTKVLQIFEKLDLHEEVITLAHHAIQVAKKQEHDANVPTLWSSVFRHSNSLLRHSEAFEAILLNPDSDHRKDCLRTFAVSLCENKKYSTLIRFEYDDLENDLVSILEHRARGSEMSLSSHNYYDLMYAFHVHRGNFRRAASAMYEQAYRLGCELGAAYSAVRGSVDLLQRQLDSYVSCVNCLNLVVPDNRWILHPFSQPRDTEQQPPGYTSPKRHHGGEVAKSKSRKIVIKELEDIRKEALLTEMMIKLEGSNMHAAGRSLVTPTEIAMQLCHTGLYDDAIFVCQRFDLDLTAVFSSLATRCAKLSFTDEAGAAAVWEWLSENETAKLHCSRVGASVSKWSTADSVFRLLQVYLEKLDGQKTKGTPYFQAIAKSLLSLGAPLPAWFVNAYKERNCPELLRLLVCYDRLEDATSLTIESIDAAILQIRTDLYGKTRTHVNAPWLPYTIIDQLLSVLGELQMQEHFDELYHSLNDALEEYTLVVETAHDDVVALTI